MITLVEEYDYDNPMHNEWWIVYGSDVVNDLESRGIIYDDVYFVDFPTNWRPEPLDHAYDECLEICVTDEESVTMLKLMS